MFRVIEDYTKVKNETQSYVEQGITQDYVFFSLAIQTYMRQIGYLTFGYITSLA